MATFCDPHYHFLLHWHNFSPAQLFKAVIYHDEKVILFSCMVIHTLLHGCTHSGHQITFMTKFCMVGLNVCGFCLWNVLDFSLHWLIWCWVRDLVNVPMHLVLKYWPFVPILNHGSPVALLKPQMAPTLILLMSSGTKKNEARYTCLSEPKASHSQRMWAEVSSLTPHFLHKGLSSSPSRWRCLLRVLCPVRRPITALDCVLLNDRSLALVPRVGPKINSLSCL